MYSNISIYLVRSENNLCNYNFLIEIRAREGHTRKKERKALNNAKLQSCNYLVELEPCKKQSCLSDKLSVVKN